MRKVPFYSTQFNDCKFLAALYLFRTKLAEDHIVSGETFPAIWLHQFSLIPPFLNFTQQGLT